MAKDNKIGVHGTPKETGADKVKGTAANETKEAAKKDCKITKKQFRDSAPAGVPVQTVAIKKEFTTGTLGYYAQVSADIMVDGVPVKLIGNVQLYVSNSKEAKEE